MPQRAMARGNAMRPGTHLPAAANRCRPDRKACPGTTIGGGRPSGFFVRAKMIVYAWLLAQLRLLVPHLERLGLGNQVVQGLMPLSGEREAAGEVGREVVQDRGDGRRAGSHWRRNPPSPPFPGGHAHSFGPSPFWFSFISPRLGLLRPLLTSPAWPSGFVRCAHPSRRSGPACGCPATSGWSGARRDLPG